MGYIKHHAIVVTGWEVSQVSEARDYAIRQQMTVTEVATSPVNGYWSFLVAPDGSKEGWEASLEGDIERDTFVLFLEQIEPGHGGRKFYALEWSELIYGDEAGPTRIVRSSDRKEGE
jgi:hypothetical protein